MKLAYVAVVLLTLQCSNAFGRDDEAEAAYQDAAKSLQNNDWLQAEIHFERVLMLNPEHAEARIQLAVLLAKRGQIESAKAFIRSLVDDPRTPATYKQRLVELLLQIQQKSDLPIDKDQSRNQNKGLLQARVSMGYSSNPYALPDINKLTITLPESNIDLDVKTNIQSAAFVMTSLIYEAPNQCGFDAYVQKRESFDGLTDHKLLLFCNNEWSREKTQFFTANTQTKGGDSRNELGVTWLHQPWRMTAQIYNEPQMNRNGYTFRVTRQSTLTRMQSQIFAEVEENFQNTIPGYIKTGLSVDLLLINGFNLLINGAYQRDFTGYSPLLERGANRTLFTAEVGLSVLLQEHLGWKTNAEIVQSQRWSNLPLFDFKDVTLKVNARRNF